MMADGEGVVGAGGVEERLARPGLVEEPAELVGRDLGLGRGEELRHRHRRGRPHGGTRVGSQSPSKVSLVVRSHFVKLIHTPP